MAKATLDGSFLFGAAEMRAWEEPTGRLRFEGVASSTAVDRQRERMSEEAIERMAQSEALPLLPGHKVSGLEQLGVVDECIADGARLIVRGELDASSPRARQVFAGSQAGRSYGLSVGGKVVSAHWERDEGTGRRVRVVEDVVLDHVAICDPSQAVNPDAYLGVVSRLEDGSGGDEGVEPGDGRWCGAGGGARAGGRLVSLAKRIAGMSRLLWGAGGGAEGVPEEGATRGAVADLGELRGQLVQVVADLTALARGLEAQARVSEGGLGAAADPAGPVAIDVAKAARADARKSSLNGQERTAGQRAQLWKGVL